MDSTLSGGFHICTDSNLRALLVGNSLGCACSPGSHSYNSACPRSWGSRRGALPVPYELDKTYDLTYNLTGFTECRDRMWTGV